MSFKSAVAVTAALWLAGAGCGRAPEPPPGPEAPLPSWLRPGDPRRPIGRNELAFRWYGTAAFSIRTAHATVWLDPYLTRDSLWTLLRGPARPRPERWPADLATPSAVFVGHAHFDHFLDAPEWAKRSGALLYGSGDALRVARAEGLPDRQLRVVGGGSVVQVGDIQVEVVSNRHSDIITQWLDGGAMPADVRVPMWFLSYKNGPVYAFLVRWRGRVLAHIDTAQLVEESLDGRKADVALVCLSGWSWSPTLFARLYEALGPDVVVPMHHDDFFRPLEAGFVEGPLARVRDAQDRIRRDMPGTAMLPIAFFQEYRMTAPEAP